MLTPFKHGPKDAVHFSGSSNPNLNIFEISVRNGHLPCRVYNALGSSVQQNCNSINGKMLQSATTPHFHKRGIKVSAIKSEAPAQLETTKIQIFYFPFK